VFEPADHQTVEGLVFFIAMFSISFSLYVLLALFVGRKDIAAFIKSLTAAFFGLVFFLIVMMAFYFPFWLFGGKSNFWGTGLAYIYSVGPLIPILALLTWIGVAAMPPYLRPYAFSPNLSVKVGEAAAKDSATQKFPYFVAGLGILILIFWGLFRIFQSVSFVHDLGGWRLAGAAVLSMAIVHVMKKLFDPITSLVVGELDVRATAAAPPAA
jgi:hypothetical protein